MNKKNICSSDFKLLDSQAERKLSLDEKIKYYEELRKYVATRPLQTTTIGATTVAPKLKGVTTKIAEGVTRLFSSKDVIIICEGQENIPEGTVIYAQTHQGILDNFVWIPQVKQHCIILHGAEVNKLLLLCQVNTGLVLVKKGDAVNNLNAKLDMIRILCEGHSISYFPEGTWNLSPNKIHLPLSYGFLDVACKAKVPVVPVAHEFTYDTSTDKEKITKIRSRFGKPIFISESDDIKEKLEEYKEAISTMKYELMEEKGLFERKTISNWDYINFLKGNYANLKLGKLNLDKERRYIFGGDDSFYLFHHINDVPYDENGNLLDTKEVQKLKKLNNMHLK